MPVNLDTTNKMLGIMAAVSVLEGLLLIGLVIGGFVMYRRLMQLITDLEVRHIAPVRAQVDAILTDVKAVTARVNHETGRANEAINGTFDRVDETAERVKASVREKVHHVVAVARGLRAVVTSVFGNHRGQRPEAASGRASG